MISNVPFRRGRREIHDAGADRAVHQPNRALTGHAILPENVRLAVAVKVSCPGDVPVRRNIGEIHAAGVHAPFINQIER